MTTSPPSASSTGGNHRTQLGMLLIEVAGPLALFYGLRWGGVGQWLALVLSGAVPVVVLTCRLITERRVKTASLFTLSILVCGTAVGLVTGDPRLLLARESYLTALLGLWVIGTLWASRPFLLGATLPLLPAETARSWENLWRTDASFRRVMRVMTLGWGVAFLVDAVARVIMAYTLPVDLVPLFSILVLVVLLIAVNQAGKAYGKRLMVGSGTGTDDAESTDNAGPADNAESTGTSESVH